MRFDRIEIHPEGLVFNLRGNYVAIPWPEDRWGDAAYLGRIATAAYCALR